MFIGPIFSRELVVAPRRPWLFIYRAVYAAVLFGVICTAWLVLTGTQAIRNVGDMARFGAILFQLLAPLQLAMMIFFSALAAASTVALEKDRKTLVLLLMTRLSNSELVLGKLCASLLHVLVMMLAALPVFALALLFGGISFSQVLRVFLVTLVTTFAAGSLGSTLAFWREKTFQTLALTALLLVFWLVLCEALAAGIFGAAIAGLGTEMLANWLSPFRAVLIAARPIREAGSGWLSDSVLVFTGWGLLVSVVLNLVAIVRVRIWNPSREVRRGATGPQAGQSIWSVGQSETAERQVAAEAARQQHVDAQRGAASSAQHRQVWQNPVLWREICTWAYGRKILIIRAAYLLLFLSATAGLVWVVSAGTTFRDIQDVRGVLPREARPLVPFLVVSLVMLNALAVTSITSERDGRSLDLLLVTDLRPGEFLFGKLGGVCWVAKEMILLPILLCVYLWWVQRLSGEGFAFVVGGLVVMDLFVAMLGIHCGMTYANSRTAIGISLGTVFFLFLGITTCILMMISFSGSFHVQLAPFLAFILGGGVGLYVALGIRNPSPAILMASLVLPFATFYAIISYLLDLPLAAFLVTAVAYAFATAAMMVPALAEFDFALGRHTVAEE